MARRLFVLFSLAIALFVAACEGPGQADVEPPAPLPTPTLPPQLGGVQHVGEPIDRPLSQTTEIVQNCGGGSEPIVKHPSLGAVSANSVEWEVGGQFGFGLKIQPPGSPVGVDLTGVIEVADRTKLEQNLQQGVSWDLPAAPGEIMTYNLSWSEQWQPATVEVRFSDQDVRQINVTYRTGVESNIENSNVQYCNGFHPTSPPSDGGQLDPANAPLPSPTPTQTLNSQPVPTATTTTISRRVCGDEGAFEARNTPNPTFLRPTGFVSGWLSSDPAKITLPDGTSRTFETQFVLIVQDSEWVRIDGVGMANGNAQAWGCWYTTNEFVEQDAMQDMCIKQKAGSFGRLYRVDYNGLTELGTTQTIECP